MLQEQKIYSQFSDLVEKDVAQSLLAKPTAEEEAKVAEKTGQSPFNSLALFHPHLFISFLKFGLNSFYCSAAALDIIINASLAAAAPTKIKQQNLNEPVLFAATF